MVGEDLLSEHGRRVAELSTAVQEVRAVVDRAASGLDDLLEAEAWREFTGPGGELTEHDDFSEFVTADPPRGLGVSPGMLRGLVAENPGAATRLDRALFEAAVAPLANVEPLASADPISSAAPASSVEDVSNVEDDVRDDVEDDSDVEPTAKPKETPALRRLREDAPTLHNRVVAGEMSTHAAMVQAGFRTRTISVPVSRPESAAKALRNNLSREDLVELVGLLSADLHTS